MFAPHGENVAPHGEERRVAARLEPCGYERTACRSVLRRPGGIGGEFVPDPIPNSAVKLPSADGTKPQGLEE